MRLRESTRERIADGILRTGDELPKLETMRREYHVSRNTLVAVLRRLCAEGVLHRNGKAYRVGPAVQKPTGASPVILLLCASPSAWSGLYFSMRTRKFPVSFMEQASMRGIRLVEATPYVPVARRMVAHVHGAKEIRRFMATCSGSYLGALIVSKKDEIGDLQRWVRLLRGAGRPVVWFDRADEGKLAEPVPHMTWCRYGADAMTQTCVDYLHGRGHTDAAFLFSRRHDWERRRFELLRDLGAKAAPALMVSDADIAARALDRHADLESLPEAERTRRVIPAHVRAGTSCLIACNDLVARNYLIAVRQMGIVAPRKISVISFDNVLLFGRDAPTSVDPGFGRLTYLAFHTIVGVLPLGGPSHRTLTAAPFIVERGTVAQKR